MSVSTSEGPVVVSACGGSGTRVLAHLLISAGIHLGTDLNDPLDNLSAVLLFNRRTVLLDTDEEFVTLFRLMRRRMMGDVAFSPDEVAQVKALAERTRQQHSAAFLAERARKFLAPDNRPVHPARWGFKMPPSHVFLHRLLQADRSLRYIHLVRHGLDMAFSRNQNQLRTWGPVILDRDVAATPHESFSYCCETQARVRRLAERHPDRVLMVRFEDLCEDPAGQARRIFRFVGHDATEATLTGFAGYVTRPDTLGRFRSQDLSGFRPADLERLVAEGYRIET